MLCPVKVDEFFTNEGLQWSSCVGVCTDGAAAMLGGNIGFVSKVNTQTIIELPPLYLDLNHRNPNLGLQTAQIASIQHIPNTYVHTEPCINIYMLHNMKVAVVCIHYYVV